MLKDAVIESRTNLAGKYQKKYRSGQDNPNFFPASFFYPDSGRDAAIPVQVTDTHTQCTENYLCVGITQVLHRFEHSPLSYKYSICFHEPFVFLPTIFSL